MAMPPRREARRDRQAAADPGQPGRLLGRTRELETVLQLLERPGVVTLVGLGGVGKTTLALEVLAIGRDRGTFGAFVDLRGVRDDGLIYACIAVALGAIDGEGGDIERIARRLSGFDDATLVLDNLEHLPAAGTSITRLRTECPAVRVVGTSRSALGIPNESVIRLGPLELPQSPDIADVTRAPATALFIARAREVGRLEPLDREMAADIARLCRRLDGLPLAIELAAGRTRLLTPRAIERRLADGGDPGLLSKPGDMGAHRSLEAVFDWTFALLGEDERRMLTSVAICVGPFDLATAARLCPGVAPLDVLDQLVATSLVLSEPDRDGEPQLRLLEVVREACLQRFDGVGLEGLRHRHAAAMVAAVEAEHDHLLGPDREAATARLAARIDDLRTAFDHALDSDPGTGIRLVAPIWRFWSSIGLADEAISRLRRALSREIQPTRARAWALAGLAGLLQGDVRDSSAGVVADEAVRIARRVEDRGVELEALPALALSAIDGGDEVTARRVARRALSLARALGDGQGMIRALATLGLAEGIFGSHAKGIGYLKDAVAAARLAGDPLSEAIQLLNLAELELDHRRPREALGHASASVGLLRGLDRGPYLTPALLHMGAALTELGRLDDAREAFDEGTRLVRMNGIKEAARPLITSVLPYLARVGALELAVRSWGVVLSLESVGIATLTPRERRIGTELLEGCAQRVVASRLRLWVRAGERSDPLGILDEIEAVLRRPRFGGLVTGTPSQFVLTPREGEILRLLGEGLTDRELSERLGISPKTASVHVANIKSKLAVRTRLDAAIAGRALMDSQGVGWRSDLGPGARNA